MAHEVIDREKLNGLDSAFKLVADQIVEYMRDHGWRLRIVWGRRTIEENQVLVDSGTAKTNSKHLRGKAVDLIDRSVAYSNDRNHQYYKDLKDACDRYGAKWGGDFLGSWDPTHFESRI